MKLTESKLYKLFLSFWVMTAIALASPAYAQMIEVEDDEDVEGDIVTLSPFVIDATGDEGYRATNTISGSRLNTPIQDMPMPIEVITQEFIEDTGAVDLRESLQYSAGIILESQNDADTKNSYTSGGFDNVGGGVHNPEGATSNKSRTTMKVRGFVTDTVLRKGYRRQHATDSVNIERIEVVRGPAALLYGIGNFGGIVNYMPKMPYDADRHEIGITLGSDGFKRFTFDSTGPLTDKWGLGYRVTGAWEDSDHWTDLLEANHYFISPVFKFNPTEKTSVSLEFEYGEEDRTGVGFQSVRARTDVDPAQQDRLERAGFLEFDGKELRTFRWSGPDTYVNSSAWNFNFELTHQFLDNLNVLLGMNQSKSEFDVRDVGGAVVQNQGPEELWDTIVVKPLDTLNGDAEFGGGPVDNAIFQYWWMGREEEYDRQQVRAEVNYNFDMFDNSRWLRMEHSFLLGRSEEFSENNVLSYRSEDNEHNWKSPTDSSYIRFGTQGDGTADVPFTRDLNPVNKAWNQGTYAVYHGRFLDDRVTAIFGIRRDRNDQAGFDRDFREDTFETLDRDVQEDDTTQWGISAEVIPGLTVFALESSGIKPNFDGFRDGNNVPISALTAESEELGVKVDLFGGKVSGTVSAYRIKRTGTPFFYWWSPAPFQNDFDGNSDIIYNVGDFNPATAEFDWKNGALSASQAQWDAAVAAGAAYQINDTWYLNASTSTGAAYLDAVFDYTKANPGWPGWLYTQDDNTNNSFADIAADEGSRVVGDDESSGWDAQLMIAPIDNLQMVLTYSQTTRKVMSAGNFPQYPFPQDRWAVWYFPDGSWGLTGASLEDAYADPSDTSTWQGVNYGAGEKQDDTPMHSFSFWGNYKFTEGRFDGLAVGLGGQWEDKREYFSGITDGAGQLAIDENGDRVVLYTDDRLNLDLMLRYDFQLVERDASVQLNINNLLDDEDLYGLVWAPGRSFRLQFNYVW